MNTIRVSNSLEPDQAQPYVGPDLGPNCLQRLSKDDRDKELSLLIPKYSLLSIPRISRDWAKYVELSVVRGNQFMTYTHHFGAK